MASPSRRSETFRRTTDSSHDLPVAENVVRRQFDRRRAERGVGHRHHVHLDREGWLYLAAILDLFSRRVVGWATARSLSRELALERARRGPARPRRRSGPRASLGPRLPVRERTTTAGSSRLAASSAA